MVAVLLRSVRNVCDAARGRQLYCHLVGARHDGCCTAVWESGDQLASFWLKTSASQVGLAPDAGAGTKLLLTLCVDPPVSDLQGCLAARGG